MLADAKYRYLSGSAVRVGSSGAVISNRIVSDPNRTDAPGASGARETSWHLPSGFAIRTFTAQSSQPRLALDTDRLT
jgi:hypothetical protein